MPVYLVESYLPGSGDALERLRCPRATWPNWPRKKAATSVT